MAAGAPHNTSCCRTLPALSPSQAKIVPESILQVCIKVSNEPPSDMKSNMRRAFAAFSPEAEQRLSTSAKRAAYKSILFGLCFYHSLLLGRKKFGTGIGTGGRRVCVRAG
jgi:dynein heavy chain